MGISDLPIFDEGANQTIFMDDMEVNLLDISNSDDYEHTAGRILHVSSRSMTQQTIHNIISLPPRKRGSNSSENEVTATVEIMDFGKNSKCQSKCDNYATVQDEEEEEDTSTDGLLDDHGKRKIERRARSFSVYIEVLCGIYIYIATHHLYN